MNLILSSLTDAELAQVVSAFDVMDAMLLMLEKHGIITEETPVDFTELYETAFQEDERRSIETAEFVCEQGITVGHLEKVIRPDGEIGYTLTDAGYRHIDGLNQ